MRICIDARMMGPLATRGIGRYVEELIRAMLAESSAHQFVLLVRDPETSPFIGHPSVEHIKADVPWYGWREQIEMPKLFREAKADIVHVPHWNVPLAYRGPLVVTIHDLLLRHQPMSTKASTRDPMTRLVKHFGYRIALGHAVKTARKILVPTQFVADEVRHFYPSAPDKLIVTGEGLTGFGGIQNTEFRIQNSPYLLYVGSAYPHKRLDLLLDAWAVLQRRGDPCGRPPTGGQAQGLPLQLIIAGEKDQFMEQHIRHVDQKSIQRVTFTGRVTDQELAALYQHAALFVFPSSYEGFGLPPLEALSFGCPVVASDIACLREVLPDRGVRFFRNGDRDDMIRTLKATLAATDAGKKEAQSVHAEIGQRHAWLSAAQRTLDAYAASV